MRSSHCIKVVSDTPERTVRPKQIKGPNRIRGPKLDYRFHKMESTLIVLIWMEFI